jgi:voltage-gated potassium channel Kch
VRQQRAGRGERLRYRFDNFMSRGTTALIIGLAIASALLLIGAGVVLAFVDRTQGFDFLNAVWQSFLHTIDSGYIENDTKGSGLELFTEFIVTLGGIFVVAILIGIIGNGIQQKLTDLRKGRSRVIENGHVVILGWNQQIFAVLSELVEANANHRGRAIAILADRDMVEMEDSIRQRIPDTRGTRIVCRSGDPVDLAELEVINVQSSRSIIVLAPDAELPDADVIKALLAIINDPNRRPEPYHVVAELQHQRSIDVARMVGHDEVELVLIGALIARITAQTCRQPGLSSVYSELLDFEGDEIYTVAVPELTGRTFSEALFAFETSSVIGVMPAGRPPKLNPTRETVIGPDDKLVLISKDDNTISATASGTPDVGVIKPWQPHERRPERTLLLGWNWRVPLIVRELEGYVANGSSCTIVADEQGLDETIADLQASCTVQTVSFRFGHTNDRELLDSIDMSEFDHVVIVAYSGRMDVQRADGRTLVTLLHLRDIAEKQGHTFSIVSEMLDVRNRALAEVARADDFIVSDRLVSLYLAQVAENKALAAVFEDLFHPAGSEIFLRPASDYVVDGAEVDFYTIVEAAHRRFEVAIGYRRGAQANSSHERYGVVVNPPKSERRVFAPEDRIIVLAEN